MAVEIASKIWVYAKDEYNWVLETAWPLSDIGLKRKENIQKVHAKRRKKKKKKVKSASIDKKKIIELYGRECRVKKGYYPTLESAMQSAFDKILARKKIFKSFGDDFDYSSEDKSAEDIAKVITMVKKAYKLLAKRSKEVTEHINFTSLPEDE